jgi:hypothetical protein
MHAQIAGNAIDRTGWVVGETVSSPAVVVNLFDFRTDLFKMFTDTLGTKTDNIRDGQGTVSAVITSSHGLEQYHDS